MPTTGDLHVDSNAADPLANNTLAGVIAATARVVVTRNTAPSGRCHLDAQLGGMRCPRQRPDLFDSSRRRTYDGEHLRRPCGRAFCICGCTCAYARKSTCSYVCAFTSCQSCRAAFCACACAAFRWAGHVRGHWAAASASGHLFLTDPPAGSIAALLSAPVPVPAQRPGEKGA